MMPAGLPLPDLGLDPSGATSRFEQLQRKLVNLWQYIQTMNQSEQTIVVVPSMSIDAALSGA